jgi:hypothetical protein
MKKNLRNVLALALGLMTTVSFAQDWNIDSRTRIDMSGDGDRQETDQRATLGATWGGSNWGIHVSSDLNYNLGVTEEVNMDIYEAYASTDLMGYANMTLGRQALSYGSGTIVGTNDWSSNRNTVDGATFDISNDMLDLTLGLANRSSDSAAGDSDNNMWINAGKAEGDWSINVFYLASGQNDDDANDVTAMGIDLGYSMMGGALDLAASLNSGNAADTDYDMTSYGATYNVNDNMSVNGTMTSYGENGFLLGGGGNTGYGAGSWMSHGNMGHLGANQEDMAFGISYDMGGISLGATMHSISDNTEDGAGSTTNADYERSVTEVSLGYNISDNAGLSLKYATDQTNDDDEDTYMWLTLSVTP